MAKRESEGEIGQGGVSECGTWDDISWMAGGVPVCPFINICPRNQPASNCLALDDIQNAQDKSKKKDWGTGDESFAV